jgi:uncharacterized membrane protein
MQTDDKDAMNSYIVRIYRKNARNRRGLVGVVEAVDTNVEYAFHGVEALWKILTNSVHDKTARRRAKARGSGSAVGA